MYLYVMYGTDCTVPGTLQSITSPELMYNVTLTTSTVPDTVAVLHIVLQDQDPTYVRDSLYIYT
jgi:hypothetical protein